MGERMKKKPLEWLRQADFDMDTADLVLGVGRFFYAVFMCHLALEKALKGVYTAKLRRVPPKTHSLVYLVERMKLHVPDPIFDYLYTLNRVSAQIRYPDDLHKMLDTFSEGMTRDLLMEGRKALEWIKGRL
ncbi:MAG: HEPN domain-containing protein [Nitrospinae bacterium]|nr:HEPN domain-containing protein [Nitrospinota bacterium]